MQLSKTAYYGDFAVYTVLITAVGLAAAVLDDRTAFRQWLEGLATGAIIWTLIEYALHRFVLHAMPGFSALHDRHHVSPRALIGTPTWLSLGVLGAAIFLPAWWGLSLNVASALTTGVALGFVWYGLIHHAIHHRRPRFVSMWLGTASQRHMRHHYAPQPGNFGVTTQLWDHLFGTALPEQRTARTGATTAVRELASERKP